MPEHRFPAVRIIHAERVEVIPAVGQCVRERVSTVGLRHIEFDGMT